MKMLAPKYILPSRTTLSRTIMPRKYEMMVDRVKQALAGVDSVSLTADIWTSRTAQAYIGLTCHYITDEWVLSSVLLGCVGVTGSHTAIMISQELKNVS